MTSAFESALNEVMADVNKRRDDLLRLHSGMDQIVGVARSKRRQVSAKVDGRGEIIELKLHGETYRTMAANDLAALIVDTIREARRSAQQQLWDSLADTMPEGFEVADVVDGIADWSEALSDAVTLPQPLVDLLSTPGRGVFDDIGLDSVMKGMQDITGAVSNGAGAGKAGTDVPAAGTAHAADGGYTSRPRPRPRA